MAQEALATEHKAPDENTCEENRSGASLRNCSHSRSEREILYAQIVSRERELVKNSYWIVRVCSSGGIFGRATSQRIPIGGP